MGVLTCIPLTAVVIVYCFVWQWPLRSPKPLKQLNKRVLFAAESSF